MGVHGLHLCAPGRLLCRCPLACCQRRGSEALELPNNNGIHEIVVCVRPQPTSWLSTHPRLGPACADLFVASTFEHDYPFVSVCGRELNFVKPEDSPIVFHSLKANERAELSDTREHAPIADVRGVPQPPRMFLLDVFRARPTEVLVL